MRSKTSNPVENRLLAKLPHEVFERLKPNLEHVNLDLKQVLYEPGDTIQHVYFPNKGVVSFIVVMNDGSSVEAGTVGNEGMVGLPVFFGVDTFHARSLVQVAGDAWKMKAEIFKNETNRNGPLRRLLSLYTHAFLTQITRFLACNSLHSVEKRCCRWLLLTHDRMNSDQFSLTQEFLALMLGVRRASVTEVSSKLQKKGLIRYSRGKITILDRQGLESASCECYQAVRDEYDRLLG